MSVKTVQERILSSQNEVLLKKLEEITKTEKVDKYSLNMVSDNYGFGWIYAVSGMVEGFVKLQERWCNLRKNIRCESNEAILSY